jgi:uncharacterized protein YjbI with pentapeptide repeats/class 3 adenylate cyclase
MTIEEQLDILLQGARVWNVWRRKEHPEIQIDLSGANLSGAALSGVTLRDADLREADLSGANLSRANLRGATLKEANLGRAVLQEADLSGANLTGANLSNANLQEADLSGANLSGAILSKAKISRATLRKASLNRTDLSEARLLRTNLSEANLTGATLKRASLRRADLIETTLSGADLSEAILIGANLSRANLSGADLLGADFRIANLIEANLNGAKITDACLWETQRAGWSVQGIICMAASWDRMRKEQTIYSQGEFERLYADKTKIVLHYPGGINPIEVATLPALIQRIEAIHPGCILRLHSVQEAPGGAMVTLVVDDRGGRTPAEIEELKTALEVTGKRLIGLERKLLDEESARKWAEEEISCRDKILAYLYLEQTERKLLSQADTKRKALTLMFLDLVGFSRLSEEARQAKVDMLQQLGVALLPQWNGQYINTWGDAIVAGFDNPNDGLFLACKFIQHLEVEKIEARIGMSRGMVAVQYNDLTKRMDIAGESVNVGARLEQMAQSGEVLISEELRYYPDVQEKRFIFMQEHRSLKKAVGDQQQGDLIECYSARLAEESQK